MQIARRPFLVAAGFGLLRGPSLARCDLEHVIARDVSATIAGSGESRVHADSALSVSITGSGDLYHGGSAMPTVASIGSGRVKPL